MRTAQLLIDTKLIQVLIDLTCFLHTATGIDFTNTLKCLDDGVAGGIVALYISCQQWRVAEASVQTDKRMCTQWPTCTRQLVGEAPKVGILWSSHKGHGTPFTENDSAGCICNLISARATIQENRTGFGATDIAVWLDESRGILLLYFWKKKWRTAKYEMLPPSLY